MLIRYTLEPTSHPSFSRLRLLTCLRSRRMSPSVLLLRRTTTLIRVRLRSLCFIKVYGLGSRSLTNPNQCWANGIDLCDVPFDPHRRLGITHDDVWIPIECSKNVVFWRTRAPKVKEINDPTRDQPWVPSKMTSILSKEEEERTRLMKSVKIIRRLVASLNPSEPHVPFGSKEFDVLLTSCSPV